MNFKGRVKMVSEISYKAIENAGSAQKGERTGSSTVCFFNESGNMTAKKWIDADGTLLRKDTCMYDNKGQMIEMRWYDNHGNMEKKFTYKYDANGKIVEKHAYDPGGSLYERSVYRYSSTRNMIDELVYGKDGSKNGSNNFQYDSSWNLVQETFSGNGFRKYTYKHNDNGLMIEKSRYNSGDNPDLYVYKYGYDAINNWVRKDESLNAVQILIIERSITYF